MPNNPQNHLTPGAAHGRAWDASRASAKAAEFKAKMKAKRDEENNRRVVDYPDVSMLANEYGPLNPWGKGNSPTGAGTEWHARSKE